MMGVKGGIGTEVNAPLMSKQDNSHCNLWEPSELDMQCTFC